MARPITTRQVFPLPSGVGPTPVPFFSPPKGIDVVSTLAAIQPGYSPLIRNLVLDRGVMRSRWGTEAYHDKQSGKKLQLTTDLIGTDIVADTTITPRSTAGQGSAAGWTDPDGTSNGANSITLNVGQPAASIAAVDRLFNVVGDPAAGNNIDAYDDIYVVKFAIQANAGGMTQTGSVVITADCTAAVDLEVSTDGGSSWSTVSNYSVRATAGHSQTTVFNAPVVVSGTPSQIRFRLALTFSIQGGFPVATGNATGLVKVFGAAWLTDTYPVTWSTSTSSSFVPTPRVPIRWTESNIQTYSDPTEAASAWTDRYTFPANQLNSDNLLPTYVTWRDTIVSTDVGNVKQAGTPNRIGSKGLVSSTLVSPHTTTILPHSPRAAQIAIFGNRVVAARVNEWTAGTDPWVEEVVRLSRLRWCVKNDNSDWDGLGSGFEDLFVPGGHTDEVMGTYPVNDETAIVVSERSMRRLDVTGFLDAPFKFTLLTQELGTLSRYTIRAVPGGVIFLGYDDVYIIGISEIRRIGTRALRDSLRAITNQRLAYGFADQYNSRYIVTFKEGSTTVVWQYSFLDDGWTKLEFPFDIVSIDRTSYTLNSVHFSAAYLTMRSIGGYSSRENSSKTRDTDSAGVTVDSSLEARTGFIVVDSPLRKVKLVEVQLLYEAAEAQALTFEYSVDGGDSWLPYSALDVAVTTKPTVLSVRKTLETGGLMVRVTSSSLGTLKVISLTAFAVPGAMIRP